MIQFLIPEKRAGGVYDFSRRLALAMEGQNVQLVHLAQHTVADWKLEPDATVVLQLSGYGFERRGAPLWLLREMERRRSSIKTLGIFFHELYAFGPPWASSFWLSPLQRHISRRLAELSDFWLTSREGSAQWLRRFAGDKPQAVLPVFSTIGESEPSASGHRVGMVVFGSSGLRQVSYQAAGDGLFAWARKMNMPIHDVGAPVEQPHIARKLQEHGVQCHGLLEDHGIRALMQSVQYGLLAYPAGYVAKSSVFAAYCGHGLCPVLLADRHSDCDGLRAGVHYLPQLPNGAPHNPSSIAEAAQAWYQPHSLARHAELLNRLANS